MERKTIYCSPELTRRLLLEYFSRQPKLLSVTKEPSSAWASAEIETSEGGNLLQCSYNVRNQYISGTLIIGNSEYKIGGFGYEEVWLNITATLESALNLKPDAPKEPRKSPILKNVRIGIIILSVLLSVTIMIYAYKVWSNYGEYGWYQFFASLIFHGGFGVMVGVLLDMLAVRLLNKNKKK